ncbi:MAG: AMP-binding protein, partial [Gordonia sp. (in: high G+C Gram-positive bacteria)]
MRVSPWPAELAARYRAEGLWIDEVFDDILAGKAADPEFAGRVAVLDAQRSLTYRELDDRVARLAAGLANRGIAPDDRVLLQIPNCVAFVEVVFALWRLRALPVFGLPAHREAELTGIARAAGVVAIVSPAARAGFDYRGLAQTVADQVPSVRELIDSDSLEDLWATPITHARAHPEDLAFLQLSGGSTGIPKLIPRTHADYLYSVRQSNVVCGVDADTVYLVALPVAHNFPMSSPGILGALHAGGRVVLAEQPLPSVAWELLERERVTMVGLVPPLARVWTEAAERGTEYDLSSLVTVQVGGARCPDELARRIGPALGVTLQQVFGMAEGLVCYTRLDDPTDEVIGTQGRPMSAYDELRLVDEDGNVVDDGPGFLETQGPYTIRGYWAGAQGAGAASGSAGTVPGAQSFAPDGWYRTGDIVEFSAAGNLIVRGRGTDRINRGGEKVSAEQVEEELLAHPQIRDALVVASADKYLGERTCAYVIPVDPSAPPTLPEIRAFMRKAGLAEWKLPDILEILERFPETGVGKVSRK